MTAKPRKPLKLILWCAVALLLAALYVCGYFFTCCATGNGWITPVEHTMLMNTVYAPLHWYSQSRLPGAALFFNLTMRAISYQF